MGSVPQRAQSEGVVYIVVRRYQSTDRAAGGLKTSIDRGFVSRDSAEKRAAELESDFVLTEVIETTVE